VGIILKRKFGHLSDGRKVHQFILKNRNGVELRCIEFGATITHWLTPDRKGKLEDIVLGYPHLEDYQKGNSYLGSVIGRFGNRIENGRFELDGEVFKIPQNEGLHNLHSGPIGFDKKLWSGYETKKETGAAVTFKYTSVDGENGFPGQLNVEATYHLQEDNSLHITYRATTTKSTVINLSQHSYFNLNGMKSDILNHKIMIDADTIIPIDSSSIPLKELYEVDFSPFDFRQPAIIGDRIQQDHPQLTMGSGFDHTFVLNQNSESQITVFEPTSGRYMEVITTEPGVQFYSGNHLNNSIPGKNGREHYPRLGFCLETQHFPNSPNRADFPSTRLNPGTNFSSHTIYRIGIK